MNKLWKCFVPVFFMAGIFVFSFQLFAQAQNSHPEGLAVALVIDTSGSMKENDPASIRLDAAGKAVDLLGDNDQVTVVVFSDQVTVLVPLQKAGDVVSRNAIKAKIAAITAVGDTDINWGLGSALNEIAKAEAGKKKVALLLSDGKPDLPQLLQDPQKMASYQAETDIIAGKFNELGCAIHSLALQRQEAGELLQRISRLTGGEYFFVQDPAQLSAFFQSILLVQKHTADEMPQLFFEFANKTYKENDSFPVFAGIKLGQDTLVPGPHLQVDRFDLIVRFNDMEPVTIAMKDDGGIESADAKAGDGVFSAVVQCAGVGEAALEITAGGTYRNKAINENVKLGAIMIKPEFSFLQQIQKASLVWINSNRQLLLYGSLALIAFALLVAIIRRRRRLAADKVNGKLVYWVDGASGDGNRIINLSAAKKNGVVIATNGHGQADFILPVINREFAFEIRKVSKAMQGKQEKDLKNTDLGIYYMVISMPGTFIVYKEMPRSRQMIFEGDSFKVGGYVFKFHNKETKDKRKMTN